MNTGQIQVRISLTDQLYQFLLGQSNRLGIPVTQVVKHMIIEKAQDVAIFTKLGAHNEIYRN